MNYFYQCRILIAVVLSLLQLSLSAQFLKVFKSSPYDQEAQDVLPTPDGGYMFVGYTTNATLNDCDILILKSDGSGNELWRKTYGGSKPDFPYHMCATSDGNFLLVGYSQSYGGGDYDIFVMKFDQAGNEVWKKTYGGWGNDLGREIIPTADGNYLIVGSSNSQAMADQNANLIKIDGAGTVLWNKEIGGTSNDFGNCVRQTSDGGFIMVGQTYSYGSPGGDAYLVRLNGNGDTTWTRRFGGAQNDEGYWITIAGDGGFVFLVRDSSSVGKDIDVRIIKTDANGNEVWNKVYGGAQKDTPKMIQNTSDGGFIVAAISRSFGWVNPDMWILKCNSSGDTTWTRHYGGVQNEHCYVVREMPDGSFIATGKTASYSPDFDPIFVKLNSNGTLVVGLDEDANSDFPVSIYPNPNGGVFRIDNTNGQIKSGIVFDLLGNRIELNISRSDRSLTFQIPDPVPGIYLVQLQTDNDIISKRIILKP